MIACSANFVNGLRTLGHLSFGSTAKISRCFAESSDISPLSMSCGIVSIVSEELVFISGSIKSESIICEFKVSFSFSNWEPLGRRVSYVSQRFFVLFHFVIFVSTKDPLDVARDRRNRDDDVDDLCVDAALLHRLLERPLSISSLRLTTLKPPHRFRRLSK